MKVRIQEAKKAVRQLPEVNEFWAYKNGYAKYLRVEDNARAALAGIPDDTFVSVCLSTGTLHWSPRNTTDQRIMLQPVGGELVLEEAE